jgi:hypothetical protein
MPRRIFTPQITHTRRDILKFQFIQVYSTWRYAVFTFPKTFPPCILALRKLLYATTLATL